MIANVFKKVFGTQNDRELKKLTPFVGQINQMEAAIKNLTDSQLQAKTAEFREKLAKGARLDDILVEAFATIREAARRILKMRHFDVQLIGGMALHQGRIAEMKTGEGKTLVATLAVYLNALNQKGVHVVTVNDYLATRDSAWMGKLYGFMGLKVGAITSNMDPQKRIEAYQADITYGTNNEFGFDYLRDNMKFSLSSMVQRELAFAIVDEVDSILIDEARTPLIISGPAEHSVERYQIINRIIPALEKEAHYQIDEKARTSLLTEEGVALVEERLKVDNLYDPRHIDTLHHVNQALRAHTLYQRDKEYVVRDNKVVIVDEFTGRLMDGRRWSDGLHQAVEAKEGVPIENENQTLATITLQNYFRLYKKLAGMTGTADTEALEFSKIYNLDVLVIPTNKPLQRKDHNDLIFKNERAKFKAVVEEIEKQQQKGRPVLVGTIAVEKSEKLSEMLKKKGVKHHVLNAKKHQSEAEIVAQAGRPGQVTVSTNMAGRGTDIMLGGNPEFLARQRLKNNANEEDFANALKETSELCDQERQKVLENGGLMVIGTERHESRRIDNQLRGRSGRQGDPGETRFYVSLEDDLMRIFGGERMQTWMNRMGMEEDEVIEHRMITKALANAQKKVEADHFSSRKRILEYDDVMNQQRKTVYARRKAILKGEEIQNILLDMLDDVIGQLIGQLTPPIDETQRTELSERLAELFGPTETFDFGESSDIETIGQTIFQKAKDIWQAKLDEYGAEVFTQVRQYIMLNTLDQLWKDHLLAMDHLREGIYLRGYGQKDPLIEYKKEGFNLFEGMIYRLSYDCVEKVLKVQVQTDQEDVAQLNQRRVAPQGQVVKPNASRSANQNSSNSTQGTPAASKTVQHSFPKVGRNDPCPCGSGKKYKKCHGRVG